MSISDRVCDGFVTLDTAAYGAIAQECNPSCDGLACEWRRKIEPMNRGVTWQTAPILEGLE